MLTFFVFLSFVLAVLLIRTTNLKNKRINLLEQLQNNLLAVIADSPDYKKSINKYFFYMEHTLKVQDFESLAKEMCQSLNIIPEYDHKGLISNNTLKELTSYNARYAKQMNTAIRDIIERHDDESSISE